MKITKKNRKFFYFIAGKFKQKTVATIAATKKPFIINALQCNSCLKNYCTTIAQLLHFLGKDYDYFNS